MPTPKIRTFRDEMALQKFLREEEITVGQFSGPFQNSSNGIFIILRSGTNTPSFPEDVASPVRDARSVSVTRPDDLSLDDSYTVIPFNSRVRGTEIGEDDIFRAQLDVLRLALSSLDGGASSVTVKITMDSEGDHPVTPESIPIPLVLGETTVTAGSAVLRGDGATMLGDVEDEEDGAAVLYLWVKLDSGTADLDSVFVSLYP